MPSFKDFLKEEQKEDLSVASKSISLVLLPIFDPKLHTNQYILPHALNSILPSDRCYKTYNWEISECVPRDDLPDLVYHLKCQFMLADLESLVVQEGESHKILQIIVKEIFENFLYDCYENNKSLVILNNNITIKFTRKLFWNMLRRTLIKWRDIEQSVYHSDQLASVWLKILKIMNATESEVDYSMDEVEDEELFESLQRDKGQFNSSPILSSSQHSKLMNPDHDLLYIDVRLASKKDPSKVQDYKIIRSIEEFYHSDNIIVEFESSKDHKQAPDSTLETSLFNHLYFDEVIKPVCEHYNSILNNKSIDKNYIMIYGQKATQQSVPYEIFYDVDFEYIDLNHMMILNSDMIKGIKYLSNFFLNTNDSSKKQIYVLDHLDWVIPKVDSSEVVMASRRIKQNQVLKFFLQLIDSKKYTLLFLGRHYQNINSELAGISRIDKFVQVNAPDSKKRMKAFEYMIDYSYKLKIGKFECKPHDIDENMTKSKYLSVMWSQLAAKTEHYSFSNLVQIWKTFIKQLENKAR